MKIFPLFITTILILLALLYLPSKFSSDKTPGGDMGKIAVEKEEIPEENPVSASSFSFLGHNDSEKVSVEDTAITNEEQQEETVTENREAEQDVPLSDLSPPAKLSPEEAIRNAGEKFVKAQQEMLLGDPETESGTLLLEAEEILTKALADNPEHKELLTRRVDVYLALGDTEKALDDMNTLIDSTGGWPEIMLMRCMVLEKQGMPEGAYLLCYEAVCERYEKKEKPLPTDFTNWAFAEMLANHPEKAESLLERAKDFPEFAENESWLLLQEEFWNLLKAPDGTFDRKSVIEKLVPSPNVEASPTEEIGF